MPLLGTRGSASATGFGFNLLISGRDLSGARGVTAGGQLPGGVNFNQINYFTISTAGNALDFGDLTNSRATNCGVNSLTRGVFSYGNTVGSAGNVLDYITIASTGNATDFGDAVASGFGTQGSACNETRGLFAGGYIAGLRGVNVIQYITIATTGNATDFGDLTVGRYQVQTQISSPTRGIWAGGQT